ncbi:MAG: hypothetical protein R3F65_31840 [bacterium]
MSDRSEEQAKRWVEALFAARHGGRPEASAVLRVPAAADGAPRVGVWAPGAPVPLVVAVDAPAAPEASATGDWTRDPLVAEARAVTETAAALARVLDARFVVATALAPAPGTRPWRVWRGAEGMTVWLDGAWLAAAGAPPLAAGAVGQLGVPLPAEAWGTAGVWAAGEATETPAVFVGEDGVAWGVRLAVSAGAASMRVEGEVALSARPRAWFSARCGGAERGASALEVARCGVVALREPVPASAWGATWVAGDGRVGIRVEARAGGDGTERTTVLDRGAMLAMLGRER